MSVSNDSAERWNRPRITSRHDFHLHGVASISFGWREESLQLFPCGTFEASEETEKKVAAFSAAIEFTSVATDPQANCDGRACCCKLTEIWKEQRLLLPDQLYISTIMHDEPPLLLCTP